jgi:hypothetical protein
MQPSKAKDPLKEVQVESNKQIDETQTPNEPSKKTKKHKKKQKDENTSKPIDEVTENDENEKESDLLRPKERYQDLASNKHVALVYRASPNYMNLNQIIIDVLIKSGPSVNQIYAIEFNILETLNTKLVRDVRLTIGRLFVSLSNVFSFFQR